MFFIFCWCALGMILELIFDRFLLDFGIENQWKIDEKWIKKQIKNKMRFGIDFWWLLGGFWGGFGRQVGAQNRPKSIPRAIWNVINFLMDLKIDFWSDLVPTWPHLDPQNPPKMEPSWLQNRCKLGCWFEGCFWKDLGTIFNDFLLQHGKAEVAKSIKNL